MKKEKVIKKVEKEFPDFVDMLKGADTESLKNNLNIYATHREEVELDRSENPKLNQLKEELKELNKPYNDALNVLKLKLAYLNILIKEKAEASE